MIKTKKTLRASFLSLMVVSAFHLSAGDLFSSFDLVQSRCAELPLGNNDAIQKTKWAKRCGLIGSRHYDIFLNDDYGQPRSLALFPLFFLQQGNKITSTYIEEQRKIHGASYNISEYSACNKTYIANKFKLASCKSGCFTPDQQILFTQGEVPIAEAAAENMQAVVTLAEDAQLDALSFTDHDVLHYTASLKPTDHDIIIFHMASGGELKVTTNHPLLTSEGVMKAAENFEVGDELILSDGSFDPIETLEPIQYHGKVHNLKTDAQTEDGGVSLKGQVIVAQGYLSGSSFYQNDGERLLNSLILRSSIPDNLMD